MKEVMDILKRNKLFTIVEKDTKKHEWYDIFILVTIWISIIPLMYKTQDNISTFITYMTVCIFIIDYILRWITEDIRKNKKGIITFLKYPFTMTALFDLVVILSCFSEVIKNPIIQFFSIFRILTLMKTLKYSKKFYIIKRVIEQKKDMLKIVCLFTLGFIFISALIMFQFENTSFNNFFESIYWSTTVLTTVGYGDICPKTDVGRLISILSSLAGVAFVALPTSIITSGFVEELNKEKETHIDE